jgi:hypothetical protein
MNKIFIGLIAAIALIGVGLMFGGMGWTHNRTEPAGVTEEHNALRAGASEHQEFCQGGHLQDPSCSDVTGYIGPQRAITGKQY